MMYFNLSRREKRILKELNQKRCGIKVGADDVEAANKLSLLGLIEGAYADYSRGCWTVMVLSKKGREYYLSNPSLRAPIDWKFWISLITTVIIAVIGWLY